MDNKQIYELLEKIDSKVDRLSIEQGKQEIINLSMNGEIRKIREDLNYHIKRTDLLEHEFIKLRGFLFYVSLIIGGIGAITTIVSGVWRILGA